MMLYISFNHLLIDEVKLLFFLFVHFITKVGMYTRGVLPSVPNAIFEVFLYVQQCTCTVPNNDGDHPSLSEVELLPQIVPYSYCLCIMVRIELTRLNVFPSSNKLTPSYDVKLRTTEHGRFV